MVNKTDEWLFKSETYDNCICSVSCGCQFNEPRRMAIASSPTLAQLSIDISTERHWRG